jgi:Na+/phosphate symporter
MKYTAVDWLLEQVWNTPKDKLTWYIIYKQAKEMEKEQIKEAYKIVDLDIQHEDVGEINSEQYYKETYEKL